ncbi:MAG TPA: homoserine kinase [Nitrososphaeraceae archaeon]|nr:homoserine kinase [Nitrososphaeraceae archaeon]
MKEALTFCKAKAPSSTANLGPGFDVFGLGLNLFYDTVSIIKLASKSGKIRIILENNNSKVPSVVEENTASLSVLKIAKKYKIKNDLEIKISKGVPIGLGLGSSAASSAAAVTAFNELFQCNLSENELLDFAAEGEVSSAGVKHYDNVVASLFGGFVIVRTHPTLQFSRINAPKDLILVVCVPEMVTPAKKTKVARSVIPKTISIEHHTRNLANACMMVSGFQYQDTKLLASGINDIIVEPARKNLIPSYDKIKSNALRSGALAVTISGAGPSMIAFTNSSNDAPKIGKSMEYAFAECKIKSHAYVCGVSGGARVIAKH